MLQEADMNQTFIKQEIQNLKALVIFPFLGILLPLKDREAYVSTENLLILMAGAGLGALMFYSQKNWLKLLPYDSPELGPIRFRIALLIAFLTVLFWKSLLSLYPATPREAGIAMLGVIFAFSIPYLLRNKGFSATFPFLAGVFGGMIPQWFFSV